MSFLFGEMIIYIYIYEGDAGRREGGEGKSTVAMRITINSADLLQAEWMRCDVGGEEGGYGVLRDFGSCCYHVS